MFKQNERAGFKTSAEKSQFGAHSTEFLRKTISTAGNEPIEERITKFLRILKLPTSVETLQRNLEIPNFYKQNNPKHIDELVPLFLALRNDVAFKLMQQHKEKVFENTECLLKTSKDSLKLPLTQKQLVNMCDTSENAAGYALLIEDYGDAKTGERNKLAPVAFGSKRVTTGQRSITR